jgi:hypothetical protein
MGQGAIHRHSAYIRERMMGANDRARNQRDDKKKKAEETRRRRVNRSTNGTVADWETVSGELLLKAIATVARMGGALRLGYTRDGGAYAIGIYGDGEPFTEYVPPDESVDELMKGIIEDYGD